MVHMHFMICPAFKKTPICQIFQTFAFSLWLVSGHPEQSKESLVTSPGPAKTDNNLSFWKAFKTIDWQYSLGHVLGTSDASLGRLWGPRASGPLEAFRWLMMHPLGLLGEPGAPKTGWWAPHNYIYRYIYICVYIYVYIMPICSFTYTYAYTYAYTCI